MEISSNLAKYLRILRKSSDGFNKAIKPLNAYASEEKLGILMDRFFISKKKDNILAMRIFLSNDGSFRKFSTHISSNASPEKPSRSPEIPYPHFMVIVGEYMSPEEWMKAYQSFKSRDKQLKKHGISSIMDQFKKSELRLLRTWKTIDLQLEIYRMYRECPYPKRVADKVSEMKVSGTFPIKTGTTFDAVGVRRVVKQMDDLLRGI